MNAKIGLFFGSFNPVHNGHLMIANYMANHTPLSEVWMVISPHNPLKSKSNLINMYDRLEMVQLALEKAENIRANTIEFQLPQPSYTIDTLTHLKERYPNKDFVLIMGSDNLHTLEKWKNYEQLLSDYEIMVYPRPTYGGHPLEHHPSVHMTPTPLVELSSTFVRTAIKNKLNIQYFVPDSVLKFIDVKGLYLT